MSTAESIRIELARRELARRFYIEYLAYVNGEGWKRTRFAEYVARELQEFIETDTGNAYDILVLETPPQHGKSMTVTEALPSWCLGRHPDWRVILASYNDDSAERFARRNKEKVAAFGEALFGVSIGGVSRATEFELKAKAGHVPGRLISRGMLAGITGNSANLLIIDDPIKNRTEADSEMRRTQIWNEWLSSLKSRLAAGAKVVVIMTPWHEDDLAARLLAAEENIRLVRLPVEAEENDPLGRVRGEALCPELGKGEKWLEQFKRSYLSDTQGGERAWTALYQCSPRVEEGGLVKRQWWRYYEKEEVDRFAREVISVDAAFKGGEKNDFVAIEVWGKVGSNYYLRYCLNRHMDFPETLQAIRTVRKLYPEAMTVLIEDKANGSAIIQTLQKEKQWEAEYTLTLGQMQLAQEQWQQEFDFSREQAELSDQQWQQEFDYEKYLNSISLDRAERSQLEEVGWAMLEMGLMPDEEYLAAMGLNESAAEKMLEALGYLAEISNGGGKSNLPTLRDVEMVSYEETP